MKRPRITFITSVSLVLITAVLPFAFGQPNESASRTLYVGSVLNTTATLPAAGPIGSREPVILDLTLYDDGFAFGKLILPRRGLVVAGGGTVRDDSELRLVFRQDTPGMYGGWPAEFAHQPPTGVEAPSLPGVVATFSGYRDFSFGAEGTLITGALAFSTEPSSVLTVELHRRAEYATWELAQGRIRSSFTSPSWLDAGSPANAFLESEGRSRVDDFVREGRKYVAEGVLGWGWEMHEYVTLEGAAGSFLSLLDHVYVYTGGAHPNTFFSTYLLEIRPSGVTEHEIQDLFRADSTWLRRLTPGILEDLAGQGAAWVVQGDVTELTPNDLAAYTLSADGLTFYFAPYAMGPYVQGAFEVTLPYETLLGLAPAGGALAAFGTGAVPR